MAHFIYHFIVDSFIMGTFEPTDDQLPTSVASELSWLERRTGIARSRVQTPLKPLIWLLHAMLCGRRGGLMAIVLDSGSSGPGRGHCVLGQDTLLSRCLSPPRCPCYHPTKPRSQKFNFVHQHIPRKRLQAFSCLGIKTKILGSLSNDNGDGNKNVTNLHI